MSCGTHKRVRPDAQENAVTIIHAKVIMIPMLFYRGVFFPKFSPITRKYLHFRRKFRCVVKICLRKCILFYEAIILNYYENRGLPLASLIWIGAVLAAFAAAWFKGIAASIILPYAGLGILPACIGILLWPFANKEWVQVCIIMCWIALAIAACLAIAIIPMAFLFLCAPLVAALFKREKVVEATVLSALFAGLVFFLHRYGYLPEPIANMQQFNWGATTGIAATISFMIGAMFFTASKVGATESVDVESAKTALTSQVDSSHIYPGVVLVFSKNHILESATQSAKSLFSLEKKDIGRLSLDQLCTSFDDRDLYKKISKVFESNTKIKGLIVSLPDIANEGKYISLNAFPQNDNSIHIFATDCTDMQVKIKQLEAAQDISHKESTEKTLFFAGVSHELRTPLNAIIGFSDMMRSRLFGPLPGKYAEYANLIHDSGQHMLDLIGDVLDMSKVEAGKYELHYDKFDVADVIRSSLKMVQPSADAAALNFSVDIDVKQDLLVEADRRAVRQILLNLLSNAIKFTPKGGRVVVTARIVSDVLNICVEDNGMGMSAREINHVGEAYNQTKK